MTSRTPTVDEIAATATMIPMLPCADVDGMARFWTALGLEVTYRQLRPNPYVALRLGAIDLHYYGMPAWDPEQSHSTCSIVVTSTEPLHAAFTTGLRNLYGKVPLSGTPRITRPRRRANNAGLSGFSLVDPAGNWVRVSHRPDPAGPGVQAGEDATVAWTSAGGGPLARAVENAVVIADSHGDVTQARKVLAGALRRAADDVPPTDRAQALAYLTELALRSGDADAARAALTDLETLAEQTPGPDRPAVTAALDEARTVVADA